MQPPLSQADAEAKVEKVAARVSYFCRWTPVFLQKPADFERQNLQVADSQLLPGVVV